MALVLSVSSLSAPSAAAAGSLTAASSGPDLAEKATPLTLPVADVVVFSDRARVRREGPVRFAGGVTVLRVPDLPGGVIPDSVRVSLKGARLVRVETQPIERERYSIDQVDEWIMALEVIADQIAVVQGALGAERQMLQLLAGLSAAPVTAEKDRLLKPLTPNPAAWTGAQDRLAARRDAARTNERRLEGELRALMEKQGVAQREVQARDLGGYAETRLQVLVIADGGAGAGTISVDYSVPGAFWKPTYDLSFSPDDNTVSLSAAGLVTQASGEDWSAVKLGLSTAMPGLGITMPTLRTWTLGDDREYVPTARAKTAPRTARPFQPPSPRPRVAEVEREADRSLLAERTETLIALAEEVADLADTGIIGGASVGLAGVGSAGKGGGSGAGYGRGSGAGRTVINFEDDTIAGDLTNPQGSYLQSRKRISDAPSNAPAPPPPSPAPSAPPEYDDEADSMMDMEMAPSVATSSVSRASRDVAAVSRQAMRLRGPAPPGRPPLSDPTLPAAMAGGLDVVYDAPLPATVPSDASGLRVPLATRHYAVSTFYEATPSLSTTAYLKATVENGSDLPILGGPANVFVNGTFVGDATLTTTGPGGDLELPLGADEDIRLTRTVIPATTTQGMAIFGEEDVTTYTVKIEVGNYKKKAVTVRLIDQLPKTNAEKIKIEMVSVSPKPNAAPDGDGLLYWHVDVAPGAVKTVTFSYRITRPKGWRLHGGRGGDELRSSRLAQ
jgi:hypothetical protein